MPAWRDLVGMHTRRWTLLTVLAGVLILSAAPLPHIDGDAPLYGLIAANVVRTGDWITFHHPGAYVDKPPVVFWLMASSFHLFGVNPVTMRLWQLVLALILVALTYSCARTAGLSREQGVLAALILATSLQFYYQSTVPQQDMPLTLFLSMAVYLGMRYQQEGRLRLAMGAAAAVALAVLTKGVAGLAIFGLVALVVVAVLRPRWPHPAGRLLAHGAVAALAFIALAVPWFVAGALRGGEEFVATFFTSGTLGVGRFFSPAISNPPPYLLSIFAYVPMMALGMLPWTPVLVVALLGLRALFRQGSEGLRITAVWFLVVFIMASLSSGDKVSRYVLPCFPPAAILAGHAATGLMRDRFRLRLAAWIALVPALALVGAGFLYLWLGFSSERDRWALTAVPPIAGLAVALLAFGVAGVRGRGKAAITGAAVAAMLAYASLGVGMTANAARLDPWPAMAHAASPHIAEADRLVLFGRAIEGFNSAHLHFGLPVVTVADPEELRQAWQGQQLLVVTPEERLGELLALSPRPLVVFRSQAGFVLLANHPSRGR